LAEIYYIIMFIFYSILIFLMYGKDNVIWSRC